MADFILTTDHSLACDGALGPTWKRVWGTARYHLAIDATPAPHDISYLYDSPYLVVTLSHTDTPREVWRALRAGNSRHFIDRLGVCAGIVWNTETDAFCVFRDKFGLIPVMATEFGHYLSVTTSPLAHARVNRRRAVNENWFARFLYASTASSIDDVWRQTLRIYPGEVRVWGAIAIDAFFDQLSGATVCTGVQERCGDSRSDVYWRRRRYSTSEISFDEAVESLREYHARAISRIPSTKPPIFSLSGGLDSTSIVSAYARTVGATREQPLETFSLLSSHHESCDESSEIDVLARALPITARRFDMGFDTETGDDAIASMAYGYGPMCGPGLEVNLWAYRRMAPQPQSRMFITGYGGNFIVKTRVESILRDLWKRRRFGELARYANDIRFSSIKYIAKRYVAFLLAKGLGVRKMSPSEEVARNFCEPGFCRRCDVPLFDEMFAMTHAQERAQIPLCDEWEYMVRAIDATARASRQYFYDPLLDAELYDFCAQIPPHYWDYRGEDRAVYRAAFMPLLPEAIRKHPKSQSFDEEIADVMRRNMARFIEGASDTSREPSMINERRLRQMQRDFIERRQTAPLGDVWRLTIADWWLRA